MPNQSAARDKPTLRFGLLQSSTLCGSDPMPSMQSLLLYPRTSGACDVQGCFEQPVHFSEIGDNSCGMCFVELFDKEDRLLGENMGNEIIDRLRHI